jgi:type IV pilus biogenesis/stability protein PilW
MQFLYFSVKVKITMFINSNLKIHIMGKYLISIVCFFMFFYALFFSSCATTSSTENLNKAEVYYKIGVSHLNNNQSKEASVKFQQAIQLNPQDKHSLNALGYISARFQEHDEAISYYKRALEIDPNYSEAMNNLGVTYIEIENWEEASKYFKLALKNPLYLTPDKAYSGLGFALYKKGDYQEAEKILNESLTRYPESIQSMYALGLVQMTLGKVDTAIDTFNTALNNAPDYIDIHWELAHAYLRIGDTKQALDHFQSVAEQSDNSEQIKKARSYIELLKSNS